MVLTSAAVKTFLSEISYPIPIGIYDYTANKTRRKFPSIEVSNVMPEDVSETYQTVTTRQRFEVHVLMRIKGSASEEQVTLDSIEDLIKTKLDGVQIAGSKIILENKTWNRKTIEDRIFYYDSALTVFAVDMSAVTGVLGLQQTLNIGSITNLQLISETGTEGRDATKRVDDSGSDRHNKGPHTGTKFLEYMYTKTNFDIIQALIDAANEISVTLTEGAIPRVMTVVPVYQTYSTRYDGQKTATLEIRIISG